MAKVVVKLPAKGIEADWEVVEKDDGTFEISVEPYFYGPEATPPVLYLTTLNDAGDEVCKTALQLSGANGNFKLVNVTKRVPPRFGSKKPPKQSAGAKS